MFFVAQSGERGKVEAGLRERAADLPPYQRPSGLHSIEALPRTPTGKLLRRRLAEMLRGARA
jgi:acyl-CoA synthetase (AMP-forming)/AMP-acid ligase II